MSERRGARGEGPHAELPGNTPGEDTQGVCAKRNSLCGFPHKPEAAAAVPVMGEARNPAKQGTDFRVVADLPAGKRLAVSRRLFAVFGPELEAAFFREGGA